MEVLHLTLIMWKKKYNENEERGSVWIERKRQVKIQRSFQMMHPRKAT
jgi:hypothetical protein